MLGLDLPFIFLTLVVLRALAFAFFLNSGERRIELGPGNATRANGSRQLGQRTRSSLVFALLVGQGAFYCPFFRPCHALLATFV